MHMRLSQRPSFILKGLLSAFGTLIDIQIKKLSSLSREALSDRSLAQTYTSGYPLQFRGLSMYK